MNEMEAICVKYCFARSLFRGGSTVLPLIAKKVPSIIILDVLMPGMDGFELLQEIRAACFYAHSQGRS